MVLLRKVEESQSASEREWVPNNLSTIMVLPRKVFQSASKRGWVSDDNIEFYATFAAVSIRFKARKGSRLTPLQAIVKSIDLRPVSSGPVRDSPD